MAGNSRLLEDVTNSIELAKLNESDLERISQPIFLSAELGNENVKLLEIDNEILSYLNTGKRLVFRGSTTDFAVLCTENETYEVKEAETSNSMLLIPSLNLPTKERSAGSRELHAKEAKLVVEIHRKYLELRRCNPRLSKLNKLLMENVYRGREYELDDVDGKYTMENLLENVQCSENEMKNALIEMKACEIDGFWRVLEFEYEFRVVSLIVNLMEENSWAKTELLMAEVLDVLDELEPREILRHCLQLYASETTSGVYSLKEKEICCLHAEIILHVMGQFNLGEFLAAWQDSVPEGFIPKVEFLKGLALIDSKRQPNIVQYYPKNQLPEDIADRFRSLFTFKEKWTFDEIEPYIKDLTSKKLDASADLTYFTKKEILHAFKKFGTLVPNNVAGRKEGRIPIRRVMEIPELKVNPFRDRICAVFSSTNDETMSFEDFLDMMSVFSENAPKTVKTEYAFRVFDFDDDDMIGREDINNLLRRLTDNKLSNDEVEQITDHILQEADLDEDDYLAYAEFEHAISKSPDFMHFPNLSLLLPNPTLIMILLHVYLHYLYCNYDEIKYYDLSNDTFKYYT
uniref:Sister chromatid cohesion protein DCC1 n=1 Tax=Strigamia maritima TaxID=126957 RepID=T1IL49_STRMM